MNRISVEKHLSEKELEGLIKQEREKRLLEKLIFIKDLYDGESVGESYQEVGES